MENKFTEKKVVHKIIIALVFLIFFNWIYPCIPVYAADDDEETTEEAPWGVLLEPLIGLVSGLGEGVIWLIQSNLIGISPASVYIDINGDDGVWGFFEGFNYAVVCEKIDRRYPSKKKWLDYGALTCAIICILLHPFSTSFWGIVEIITTFIAIYGMLIVRKKTGNAWGCVFAFCFIWNAI